MTRPQLIALLVSLVLGAALVPSGADGSSPAAAQLAGPGYHQPAVGQCYDLTWKQALGISAPAQDPVPCDAPHTLMTIKVKRLSKPVRWSSDNLLARFDVACQKALYETLGGSAKLAAMSAYDWWFFYPTKEERAKGARWVRCDVGLLHARTDMDHLPATLMLGSLPLPNRVARCLVGDNYLTTACKSRHQWKAKAAFRLDFQPKTREQYLKLGARCPKLTHSRRYVFDGPSATEWKAGNHFMVCFKPD